MSVRVPALALLAAAFCCAAACTMWTTHDIRPASGDRSGGNLAGRRVERLVKTDGEHVVFSRSKPGLVRFDRVEGLARIMVRTKVEIKAPFTRIRTRADGTIAEVTDAAGQVHYVRAVLEEKPDALIVEESRSEIRQVSIPLAEVGSITFRRVDPPLTILAAAGVIAVWFTVQSYWNLTRY